MAAARALHHTMSPMREARAGRSLAARIRWSNVARLAALLAAIPLAAAVVLAGRGRPEHTARPARPEPIEAPTRPARPARVAPPPRVRRTPAKRHRVRRHRPAHRHERAQPPPGPHVPAPAQPPPSGGGE